MNGDPRDPDEVTRLAARRVAPTPDPAEDDLTRLAARRAAPDEAADDAADSTVLAARVREGSPLPAAPTGPPTPEDDHTRLAARRGEAQATDAEDDASDATVQSGRVRRVPRSSVSLPPGMVAPETSRGAFGDAEEGYRPRSAPPVVRFVPTQAQSGPTEQAGERVLDRHAAQHRRDAERRRRLIATVVAVAAGAALLTTVVVGILVLARGGGS